MSGISLAMIVRNEQAVVARALSSAGFCGDRVVVDSGSTDGTIAAARALGARVYERRFDDFASQKNHAVSLCEGPWVLVLDADETVPPELAAEIQARVRADAGRYAAYRIPRSTYFMRGRMRFGGHQDDRPVRLFLKSAAAFEGRVHETVQVAGLIGDIRSSLRHDSTATAGQFLNKLHLYTDLEAAALADRGRKPRRTDLALRPPLRFAEKYVLKAGFLDGRTGFVYAALSAYYEFVRQAKFCEKSLRLSDNI